MYIVCNLCKRCYVVILAASLTGLGLSKQSGPDPFGIYCAATKDIEHFQVPRLPFTARRAPLAEPAGSAELRHSKQARNTMSSDVPKYNENLRATVQTAISDAPNVKVHRTEWSKVRLVPGQLADGVQSSHMS